MKKVLLGLTILMFAFTVGATASWAASEPIIIKMGHVVAQSEPTHKAALEWAKQVKARTKGGIEIQVFPSAQLGKNRDVYEQARMGAPVVGQIDPGYAAEFGSPNLSVLQGPFLINTMTEYNNLVNSELVKKWNDQLLEQSGLRILTWNWYFGSRHIISDKGFKTVDELNGLKIRCPPNPVWVDTFKTLGATPVTIAWAEVYTGLSQGVVEAAEAPLSTLLGSKLFEVKKTITLTGHFNAISGLVISDKVFKSLSPEWQTILVEEAINAGNMMTEMTVNGQDGYKKELTANGVTFVEPEIEGFKQKSKAFYTDSSVSKKWYKGIYEDVQAAMK